MPERNDSGCILQPVSVYTLSTSPSLLHFLPLPQFWGSFLSIVRRIAPSLRLVTSVHVYSDVQFKAAKAMVDEDEWESSEDRSEAVSAVSFHLGMCVYACAL